MRKSNIYCALIVLSVLHLCAFTPLKAQTNLKVAFKDAASAPRNLIVCGNETNVTVTITNISSNATTISHLNTQIQLFKGILLVQFNPSQSSAGVVLTDSNKLAPTFSLPNLAAGATINISYTIRANCDFTDTLTKNNLLSVFDNWVFNYTKDGQNNLSEKVAATEYRDQIKIPYLTPFVSNNAGSDSHVGGTYTRIYKINNSSIGAWLKSVLYQNSEGAGVAVVGMQVNGTPVSFTKSPVGNSNQDTLISYEIKGNLFKNNTGNSNNDTLFDANETVTVTENLILVSCSKSRSSKHTASWGCDGNYCNTVEVTDLVKKSEGSVSVGFGSNPKGTDIIGGYCKSGKSSVVFRNNGVEIDKGAATMHNLVGGIGVGGKFLKTANGYTITAMRIGGKNVPLNDTTTTAFRKIFTTDPDGAGVGLTDADGDGYFDDLPVGQSVSIEVDYDVSCLGDNVSNSQLSNDKCFNNFSTGLSAAIQYNDNCSSNNLDAHPGYFSPFNGNALVDNCSDPDAQTDGKYFMVQHMERRSIFNFSKNCNGQEQFEVKVTLPKGISPVKDSMFLLRFEDTLKLISLTRIADTVLMRFDAHLESNINGDYTAKMGFSADCTAQPGFSGFPTTFSFICPPCNCTHVWYCDTVKGPRIHYAPSCPPNVAYDCPKGLNTIFFSANRTTFGYADSSFINKIAAKDANVKVAMPCDSVKMTLRSVVGNTPITDSLGIRIGYDNIVKGDTNKLKHIFLFDKAIVTLWHNGQPNLCTLTKTDVQYVQTDTTKFMYFDLSRACRAALPSGLNLVKGDSVLFSGDFSINTDAPITFSYEKIHNFRAYSYFKEGGKEWWCEDYGETFRAGRQEIIFSNPGSYSYPQGCAETELNYQLIIRNNDYKKYFGAEMRQILKIDSIVFKMDTALYSAFTTKIAVSLPGHPINKDSFYTLKPLDNSGLYVARFDTLPAFQTLGKVGNYVFDLRVKVQPNCHSLIGSSTMNNRYLFAPYMYYRNNFYASHYGDGSCAVQKLDSALSFDQYLTYTNVPELSLTPLTNLNVPTVSDTATWVIKVCNNSPKGAANQIWFSVVPNDTISGFKLVSFEDITNPVAVDNLTIQYTAADSSSGYIFGNGLTVNTPDKNLNDYCDIIRIRAVSKACKSIPLTFTSGWFCNTPGNRVYDILKDNCNNQTLNAKVDLQIPFVEAGYANQSLTKPGICDTTTLEILVKNTDLGTLYNLRTQLTIPLQGATLLPNSIQVAYPANSAFKNVLFPPQLLYTTPKGKTYEFNSFSGLDTFLNGHGLQGFNANAPNDSNQLRIKYRFTNDCGFQSGALSYFAFQGKTSCGVNSNTQLGESLPLQIEGAALDTQKLYNITLAPNSKFLPGTASYLEIRVKNLTPLASDGREKITVRLPGYISYVNNSSSLPEPTTQTVEGFKNITWQMPTGLKQNEEIILRFQVVAPDTMVCNNGTRSISLVTTIQKDLLCTKSQSVCTAGIITTSGGEQFYEVTVGSDALHIASSVPINNGSVKINSGGSVRLTTTSGIKVIWRDSLTGTVLTNDSVFVFSPIQKITIIEASAGASTCVTADFIRIELLDTLVTVKYTIAISDTITECNAQLPINQPVILPTPTSAATFTKSDNITTTPCTKTIKRTWNALFTDAQGKTQNLSVLQTIQQTDRTPPVITPLQSILQTLHTTSLRSGDTVSVNCVNPPIFSVADMQFTDNCDASPKTSFIDVASKKGICAVDGYVVLMKCAWVATDSCGNTSQFLIYIKIIDNTPPRIINVPADIICSDVTCNVASNLPDNIYALDGCDDKPTLVRSDIKTDTFLKRTWTATDACGNSQSSSQIIRFFSPRKSDSMVDSQVPKIFFSNGGALSEWTGTDTTFKISCENDFAISKNNIFVTDNQDKNPKVVLDSAINIPLNCSSSGYFLKKKYAVTATDSSGNRVSKTAQIYFVDSTPPQFLSAAPDTTVIGSMIGSLHTPTSTDNCSSITTTYSTVFDSLAGKDSVFTIKWLITDACGNTSTESQKVLQRLVDSVQSPQNCQIFQIKSLTQTVKPGNTGLVCLPIPLDSMLNFSIFENGTLFNARLTRCDSTGRAAMPVAVGVHTFIFTNVQTQCTDSLKVTVIENPDTALIIKPLAYPDSAKTRLGIPVVIFPLKNDINVDYNSVIQLVSTPLRGVALLIKVGLENAIQYTPNALLCNSTIADVFSYKVCNGKYCDIANVYVTNGCGKLIIYNAFSPNGDGVNDVFVMDGIEDFPETQVKIYNRWGNEVFTSDDYKNNWGGTWQNKRLPDGTYFYRVELKGGSVLNGYLEIKN